MDLGHRDWGQAFAKGKPIAAQQVPEIYQGEAYAAPEGSTNAYQVSVYAPLAPPGRRNRGIATKWSPGDQVSRREGRTRGEGEGRRRECDVEAAVGLFVLV